MGLENYIIQQITEGSLTLWGGALLLVFLTLTGVMIFLGRKLAQVQTISAEVNKVNAGSIQEFVEGQRELVNSIKMWAEEQAERREQTQTMFNTLVQQYTEALVQKETQALELQQIRASVQEFKTDTRGHIQLLEVENEKNKQREEQTLQQNGELIKLLKHSEEKLILSEQEKAELRQELSEERQKAKRQEQRFIQAELEKSKQLTEVITKLELFEELCHEAKRTINNEDR